MCDDDDETSQQATAVTKHLNSKKEGGADHVRQYGCFFAVLPQSPTIPPSALKKACEMIIVDELVSKSTVDDDDDHDDHDDHDHHDRIATTFAWTHDRVEELRHPQLPDPLPYLEISGILTLTRNKGGIDESSSSSSNDTRQAEKLCQEMIVNALLTKHDAVVGNAELLLVLADTAIPLMDRNIPIVDEQYTADSSVKQLFDKWGVVMMKDAVGSDTNVLVEMETYTMRTFEELYSALLQRTDKRRHFKEIMARDENRFDFRLDCGTRAALVEDEDVRTVVWKRLGERDGRWVSVVRELLGDDCVLIRCGCVLSLDGTGVQYWHSDGVHVGASLSLGDDDAASSVVAPAATAAPVHALCVFVPLIDLDESTGYTEFWAGSHQYAKLLSKKGEQALPGGNKGNIKCGGCLMYDYRTIHRGMPNSSGKSRPVTYFLYTRAGFEFVEDQNFTATSVYEA